MFTGADPTLENANGHRAEMYARSPDIKQLLTEREKTVRLHTELTNNKINKNISVYFYYF